MIDTPAARQYVDGIAVSMGLGDRVHLPGTTVAPSDARAGSALVVVYAIAEHTVLWCDPDLAADLAGFADDARTVPLDEIRSFLVARGWEHASRSRMLLPPPSGLTLGPITAPGGTTIRSVDAADPLDRASIEAFAAGLSAADRDHADLDRDEFDDHIVAVVDDRGIAAFASQQPFDFADGFGDIAVASRDDVRGRGLGRLAVAALCAEIEARGLVPLYRRDQTNAGSVRLCASLGFVPIIELDGIRRLD